MLPTVALCVLLQQALVLQAELGELTGVQSSTERVGFVGSGYVTGFDAEGDRVRLRFSAKAGIYALRIRYCADAGEKGYEIAVNGIHSTGMLAASGKEFVWTSAGRVELRQGENEIRFEKGWGYFDLDALELRPAPTPEKLRSVKPIPADAKAAAPARKLLERLAGAYGKVTLTGQYGEAECAEVEKRTGKLPAIRGGDFMDYSPSRRERGADPKQETEKLIAAARKGQILTISWHWNAPSGLLDRMITDAQGREVDARWYKGFYTNATSFDLAQALAHPEGDDYKLLLRDIDAIAKELAKIDRSGYPVLWRPLHEAEGKWFWWGAKGAEAYKKLWRLMFDRLTRVHRLHNLLWVHNGVDPVWYPGDDVVDVVGLDLYPVDGRDNLSVHWDEVLKQMNGRKLVALTEVGGAPDVDRMFRFGVRWSYFVSWVGDLGPKKTPDPDLRRIYRSPKVRNAPTPSSAS